MPNPCPLCQKWIDALDDAMHRLEVEGQKLVKAEKEIERLGEVLVRFAKADRALEREIANPEAEEGTDAIEAEHTAAYEAMCDLAEQLAAEAAGKAVEEQP